MADGWLMDGWRRKLVALGFIFGFLFVSFFDTTKKEVFHFCRLRPSGFRVDHWAKWQTRGVLGFLIEGFAVRRVRNREILKLELQRVSLRKPKGLSLETPGVGSPQLTF